MPVVLAHMAFLSYPGNEKWTKAGFLTNTGVQTPVFFVLLQYKVLAVQQIQYVISGGFATKFYTDEGNFDLVANDAPKVFFIQDGIKFP